MQKNRNGDKTMLNIIEQIELGGSKLKYLIFYETADGINRYGIKIQCSLFGENDEFLMRDVTTDLETAKEILFILADYTVTPCSARYVIEEYVSEKETV